MFSIYDGRASFWQWDTGQKLIVSDDVCCEVHFCNGTDDCALVCEVYSQNGKRIADVPNILLQTAKPISVYAYVQNENGERTICSNVFKVNPRPKPADYIYTETEVLNYKHVLGIANSAKETAYSVRMDADNGVFNGEQGPQGEKGPQGERGQQGEKGDKGDKGDSGDKDAVLYTEQTLTDEQKKQARENIGALTEAEMKAYVEKSILGGAW